ncbi:MAG: TRAP transporter TatT component family protein, partial [Myxococcota bacterium]
AAMARGNYAFGFIHDDLEANRIAAPEDRTTQQRLVQRTVDSYRKGRGYAERALRLNDDFAQRVGDRPFEALSSDTFAKALSSLDKEDADALFWLAFNWGGTLQATLNPADAVQLPKLEAISERVLELDDGVFYGLGPHLLAGVLKGFRAPALGGRPDEAARHFDTAKAKSGDILLPDVLKAQWVYAQTEQPAAFKKTLLRVIEQPIRSDRALLETLAKKKACRLLANTDAYFLEDPEPVPASCGVLPHKYPLRADPLTSNALRKHDEQPQMGIAQRSTEAGR